MSKRCAAAYLNAVRSLSFLVLVGAAALAACSDATAPTGDAFIVFRPDPATCVGAHAFTLFIDGDHVGTRSMAPGDSASFTVEPGPHAIGAVTTTDLGFAISFSRVIPLKAGDRYVPIVGC